MNTPAIVPSGEKILRYPDRLAEWRSKGRTSAPIGMEMDLTNRCNLGCDFCHFAYTHTRGPHAKHHSGLDMGDELDFDLGRRILDELARAGVRSVTFSGGGEPTLYPHFLEMARWARQAGLKLGLYTNGTLVDATLGEAIRELFEWVVVSIDEADSESYQKSKAVDGFAKACSGLSRMLGGTARIGASFMLRRENYSRAYEMVTLGRALKANYVEFRPAVLYEADNPARASENTRWADDAATLLQSVRGHSDVVVRWDKFYNYARWQRTYSTCSAILFTGIITPNGKLWTCVNRRGYPESEVGDLSKESFVEAWAKVTPVRDFSLCRILCRGDELNRTLAVLDTPILNEEFV